MRHNDTLPPGIKAANKARVQLLAEAAARDPAKLAKAARVVRAALDLGIITVDELTDQAA